MSIRLAEAISETLVLWRCDTLLDQTPAEIGVHQALIGLMDGRDKRSIADPFPACEFHESTVARATVQNNSTHLDGKAIGRFEKLVASEGLK